MFGKRNRGARSARRKGKRKPKRKPIQKSAILKRLLMVAFLVWAGWEFVCYSSEVLAVSTIGIQGAVTIDERAIVDACDITTADNIFLVRRRKGWEADPSLVDVCTPVGDYCLEGITRNLVMTLALELGYALHEVPDLIPLDFVGEDKECFLTGTGCGLMPVVGVEGVAVGDGTPGAVTRNLLAGVRSSMADPAHGISIHANREQLVKYLAG